MLVLLVGEYCTYIYNGLQCGGIISAAPFFTAILSRLFLKSESKLRANFFIGFVVSIVGVVLINFRGSGLELNPVRTCEICSILYC